MHLALNDYEVIFRREETIAEIALDWRKESGEENSADFSIVKFVDSVLAKKFQKKDPLHFDFFDMEVGEKPAWVSYQPLTLHIDREVWEYARLGDPTSRFIVAHEVGHLILHDHHAKAFSSDTQARRNQIKEISAEWQANIFATHFLLPDHIVLAHNDPGDLAKSCSVTRELAKDRVGALGEATRPCPKIEGDFCIRCGDFTKRVNGSIRCTTCGDVSSVGWAKAQSP